MDEFIMHTYSRQPIELIEGSGAVCRDTQGREYVDFGSGIGVNSLGYCDPDWVAAVCRQAGALQHVSNYYYTRPYQELAELLCGQTGYRKALFCNSGAEANEGALKIARKYSFDKYGADAGRNRILSLRNSFHGRTVTTLSATGQDVFHNYFFPFTEGFDYVPANDFPAAREKLREGGFCAVLVEFVQGEGGVVPLDRDYVQALAAFCAEQDILLIADEVQTGMGRTGTLLTSEQYGVRPDLTTLAKGLGGGLPIGAVLAGDRACDVLHPGDHGTTFGGNPVVCAGGVAVMKKLTAPGFLDEVRRKGAFLRDRLAVLPEVESVDGLGMMLGIRLRTKTAAQVLNRCREEGLLVLTAKAKIRLLPPLTIRQEELERGLEILVRVLGEA